MLLVDFKVQIGYLKQAMQSSQEAFARHWSHIFTFTIFFKAFQGISPVKVKEFQRIPSQSNKRKDKRVRFHERKRKCAKRAWFARNELVFSLFQHFNLNHTYFDLRILSPKFTFQQLSNRKKTFHSSLFNLNLNNHHLLKNDS